LASHNEPPRVTITLSVVNNYLCSADHCMVSVSTKASIRQLSFYGKVKSVIIFN